MLSPAGVVVADEAPATVVVVFLASRFAAFDGEGDACFALPEQAATATKHTARIGSRTIQEGTE